MEKRVLLAAVLSGLVVIVWFWLFAPPRPNIPAGKPETATPAVREPVTSPGETAAAAIGTPVSGASGPAVPAASGTDSALVDLQGEEMRLKIDPKGGTISSLVLSGYRDDAGGPLELVRPGGAQPLAVGVAGPWNEALYVVERGNGWVGLRWSDGAGNWVEKRISAGKGKYALDVEVRAGGVPARAGVVVGAGLEKGLNTEKQGRFGGTDGVARLGGKLERVAAAKLDGVKTLRGSVDFAGVEDQYFLLVMLPAIPLDEVRVSAVGTGPTLVPQVVVTGAGGVVSGTVYAGPKEHATLGGYGRGLDETVSFGIFGFLSVGFLAALRWIYGWVRNWGVAIIALTAGIRILLFPLNHKSAVAMKRMQTLQPKLKAIQDRYQEKAKKDPNVRARMNQEVMQMYKTEGVNPMGGCLPMLVQLPILWALYSLFAYAIELRQAPFVFWIKDLAAKDPTYITPILMTASMVLQQRMAPQVGDPAQRRMFMLMPFIFGFMFMSFPAGLVLYWLVNNIFTIGQQVLTERMMAGSPKPA
ncbi:MAG: membrane protein insertase YidC [Acidobacteriia bacterium]|nr:membrane protein insertase YidC [Terriglobia bacterium]